MSGLGKVDNRICIVLEWNPEEATLLQDRPLLHRQSHLNGTWETQNHQTFCMINLSLLHLNIASETPNHQLLEPRDRSHDVSVYETCACVIHTNLISYIIVAIVISH